MPDFWMGFALGSAAVLVAAMMLWWATVKLIPLFFDFVEGRRTRQF